MNQNIKRHIKGISISIIAWMIAMLGFYRFSFITMSDLMEQNPIKDYLLSKAAFVEIFLQGIIFGGLFYLIHQLFERSRLRRLSFIKIIFLKGLFYVLSLIITGIFTYIVFSIFDIFNFDSYAETIEYMGNLKVVSGIILYTMTIIILFNFVIQINYKFGPGMMFKIFFGKYFKPIEEERIFMFMDMKDSTPTAEKLGHIEYSKYIKSCFHDLTQLVIKHQAEIYQYVGDEVVLTWKINGKEDVFIKPIQLFYEFKEKLLMKGGWYLKTYGLMPEFKAGIDYGTVTATEIGDIKREIAYHGDILNSASRIQGQCNKLEKQILVSGEIAEKMTINNDFKKKYDMNYIDELLLRGKQQTKKIYHISENK